MKRVTPEGFSPQTYGPAIAAILAEPRLASLGPGKPNESMRGQLASLSLPAAFAPHAIADPEMARACLAGLWLYHDFLDESHQISQEIHTPTGSYWHALMHRREPDIDNSKYWFRRVGPHPVYAHIREELAKQRVEVPVSAAWLIEKPWDAAAFADLCETSAYEDSPSHEVCPQLQRIEWELLFDWCYRRALEA